jgi:hypothetical protein
MTNIDIMELIKSAAIAKWGSRWETDLTRRWNELYHPSGDSHEAYNNRRSQVTRMFDSANPGIKAVIELAECVDLTIDIG